MRDDDSQEYRKMRGCIEIALMRASDGKVLDKQVHYNAIVTGGRSWVLDNLLSGQAASAQVLGFIAVGTDATAPVTSDTILGSEAERKAVGTWDTTGLTATAGPYFAAQVQFATDEANTTLGELGIFNTSTANAQTMLGHANFSTINKASTNTLGVTYTISN